MRAIAMAAAMAWLLTGCGPSLKDQVEHAQHTAEEALSIAQSTASALDDGTASGNTLASEVEEAKQAADAALAAAEATSAHAEALEARIDVICSRAPAACY